MEEFSGWPSKEFAVHPGETGTADSPSPPRRRQVERGAAFQGRRKTLGPLEALRRYPAPSPAEPASHLGVAGAGKLAESRGAGDRTDGFSP